MHQTFYIDPEEEISSVIDRLNKSMSADNYFVVPKRAIFLQSIVNLKLLKREAEKVGKNIIIVTQDESGISMAERCGIDVRPALDGAESIVGGSIEEEMETEEEIHYDALKNIDKTVKKKLKRLSGVGSNDFYDSTASLREQYHLETVSAESQTKKNRVNSTSSATVNNEHALPPRNVRTFMNGDIQMKKTIKQRPQSIAVFGQNNQLDSEKEKALEKIYASKRVASVEQDDAPLQTDRGTRKIFLSFIGLCLLAFVGVAVYLFLPSAKIIIEPNISTSKADLDLHGSIDITNADQTNIPIRAINKDENLSLSYEIKGGSTVSGKKAHGNVVIYNEYDSSAQTLIATTRLESADGKIFHIMKNVVVPGATTISGEVKPGAIAAEIVADQAGEDYNIDAASFTIPGFKDSPKFGKFYAKLTEPTVGGSTDGESAAGTAVTQQDIEKAKQMTEAAIKDKISQSIDGELHSGEIVLQQGEKITIVKSSASAKIGDMATKVDYTVVASVQALVFLESDVKNAIMQSLKNDQQSIDSKMDISKIDYGTVDPDFEKGTLNLKVYGEVTSTPIINTDQIKQELLGKKDDQLADILRKYLSIKNVNVEFYPASFVSHISQYPQRVSVEIK